MRFRAELRDPSATRETKPEQAFSVNPEELEEWSIQTLARVRTVGCEVVIFETVEKPYRVIQLQQALNVINERIEAEVAAKAAAVRSKKLGLPPEQPPIT